MSEAPGRAVLPERAQFALLTRNFMARFLESDVTGTDLDLRASYLWVLAGLATPGVFFIIGKAIRQSGQTLDPLAAAAPFEKSLFIGLAMIATGMLTVLTWDSLLVDRRDSHILGALPVRSRTILTAKMASLASFWLIATTAVNAVPAVIFPFLMGGIWNGPRYLAAHVISVWLASAFVFLVVVGLQGVLVAVLGRGAYARVSSLLQLAVAGVVFLSFLLVPWVGITVMTAVLRPDVVGLGWRAGVPTIWFVALYEWLLGASWPALAGLGPRALLATCLLAAVAIVGYSVGYRRHIRRMLEAPTWSPPAGWLPTDIGLGRLLRRLDTQTPAARGVRGFVFAAVVRSVSHRLGLSLALGLGLAVGMSSLPRVVGRMSAGRTEPSIEILSIPLILIFALTCGLKALTRIPSELPATWIFDLSEPREGRWLDGARGVFVWLGVMPPILATVPMNVWLWGPGVASLHAMVCFALGLLLTEVWMRSVTRVPFTTAYMPGRGQLRLWWPLYVTGFVTFTSSTVRTELDWLNRPGVILSACAGVLALVWLLRHRHGALVERRRAEAPELMPDTPQALGLAPTSQR